MCRLDKLVPLVVGILGLTAGCAVERNEPETARPTYRVVATQGMMKMVVVPPGNASRRDSLAPVVAELCGQDRFCNLMFWEDESKAARRLPMTDSEMASLISKYERNRTTGHDRYVRWSDGEPLP